MNKLITETFKPIKSSIISHLEYSYFLDDNGNRITERIMFYFLPHVSFGFLQVEYQLTSEDFQKIKDSDSVAKYWYKNIKDPNKCVKFNVIKRK